MKKNFYSNIRAYITKHKVRSTIVGIIAIIVGYYIYNSLTATGTTPQYVLSRVTTGSITQTVTGTGQVSAVNQLDITGQASGMIQSIKVSVGQHVNAGDLIASIDPTQAIADLESARISMAKLTAAPKATDLTSAQNTLTKSYSDAFNSVANVFLDLPTVIAGMKDMLYGQSGFLSDQASSNLIPTARTYRDTAGISFDKAHNKYSIVLEEYRELSRSSATSSISQLIADTYSLTKEVSQALQNMQNTITYITTSQPEYLSTSASTAKTNINTWSSQINSDLASVLSAQNAIQSGTNALTTLVNGADVLDIESAQLSLQQKERAYANYFIRAPFDGIIGRIPVSVYSQAGSGTTIATLIGDSKTAIISLNEIDAAKVKVGQPVIITFDAIDDFDANGTVSVVDLVGTVTQGVVTYNVKISIDTKDDRVRPGMSVNTTIVTNKLENVLVVPTSAVKTLGNMNYVQIFDTLPNSTTTASSSLPRTQNRTLTISSAVAPRQQIVAIGQSDDTNTEILSGLSDKEWVVTRTTSTATTQTTTTAAPSILNSFGGARTGASATGGAFRTTVGR